MATRPKLIEPSTSFSRSQPAPAARAGHIQNARYGRQSGDGEVLWTRPPTFQ